MEPVSQAFRTMLVKLDSQIRKDELEKLKMLYKDVIKTKVREKIDSCIKLFDALEERNALNAGDVDQFKRFLELATDGRRDVILTVENYERESERLSSGGAEAATSTDSGQSPQTYGRQQAHSQVLHLERQFLETKIGKEYRHVLRHLGVEESDLEHLCDKYRDPREVIHQGLIKWIEMNKNAEPEVLRRDLVRALNSEHRKDLAKKIEKANLD